MTIFFETYCMYVCLVIAGNHAGQSGSSGRTGIPSDGPSIVGGSSGRKIFPGGAQKPTPTGNNEVGDEVEMEEDAHSHSDNQMESESDHSDDENIHGLPPGRIFRPPPQPLGPQAPNRPLLPPVPLPPRGFRQRNPLQFPGMPPLGGEEVFGGQGHRLGGKEAAIIGDSQMERNEGGKCVHVHILYMYNIRTCYTYMLCMYM